MKTQIHTALQEDIPTWANHGGFKHVQLGYTVKSGCIKTGFFLHSRHVPVCLPGRTAAADAVGMAD